MGNTNSEWKDILDNDEEEEGEKIFCAYLELELDNNERKWRKTQVRENDDGWHSMFQNLFNFFFLLFDEEWLVKYFWGSNMQEERQMVPVWPRSPVWEPKRGPGAHCGAAWGEGGSIFPISCTRHHLPLFDRRFPGSRSKLITSTVTWYGIPPVVRRYWHYILTDAKPRDVYPQECPPSR